MTIAIMCGGRSDAASIIAVTSHYEGTTVGVARKVVLVDVSVMVLT